MLGEPGANAQRRNSIDEAGACHRFPGSQPVSFGVKDLDKLERQEYVNHVSLLAAILTIK